jgi:hypothetical protein
VTQLIFPWNSNLSPGGSACPECLFKSAQPPAQRTVNQPDKLPGQHWSSHKFLEVEETVSKRSYRIIFQTSRGKISRKITEDRGISCLVSPLILLESSSHQNSIKTQFLENCSFRRGYYFASNKCNHYLLRVWGWKPLIHRNIYLSSTHSMHVQTLCEGLHI